MRQSSDEHWENAAMDRTATLTGEGMMTKYTGTGAHPSSNDIARLAYQFYEMNGWRDGHDVEDWLAAKRELTRLLSIFAN
jgi:hypothetical protein